MTRSMFLFLLALAGFTALAGLTRLFGSGLLDDRTTSARAGIEKLHQQDVSATLAHDPQALANLFTEDGVLLEPDAAAIIGRAAILAANQKDVADHPGTKVLSYKPEIKDLQIQDGVAYEWDVFDASFQEAGKNNVQHFRAKALRILRRQPDGTWKFARVMWNLAEGQNLPQ